MNKMNSAFNYQVSWQFMEEKISYAKKKIQSLNNRGIRSYHLSKWKTLLKSY